MAASLLITLPMEGGTAHTVNSEFTHNHAFHSQTSKADHLLGPTLKAQLVQVLLCIKTG